MHKTSKPPQNQHIVPRFYLENFCRLSPGRRNPTLWVYEKDKPIRPSSATHEAKERYFYTVQRDGLIDYRFEHFLGWIEGLIAPILNKFNDPQYLFKRHEKETIAFFIALMFARVRPYREYVQKSLGKKMEETIKNHAKNKELFHAQVKEFEA